MTIWIGLRRGILTTMATFGVTLPAIAQESNAPYTPELCTQIRANILGVFERYNGRLSGQFVADLKEFSRRNCDRSVPIRAGRGGGVADEDALGELKVLIAARLVAKPNK